MSEPIKINCGNCAHFVGMPNERRGECFLNPPTVYSSGVQYRPKVRDTETPCAFHKPIPAGEKPVTKEKTRLHR